MQKEFKYVIVRDGFGGEWPILFPVMIRHSTIPKSFAVSAGMCDTDGSQWRAYGESLTLDLKSRPKLDSDLLTDIFGDKS